MLMLKMMMMIMMLTIILAKGSSMMKKNGMMGFNKIDQVFNKINQSFSRRTGKVGKDILSRGVKWSLKMRTKKKGKNRVWLKNYLRRNNHLVRNRMRLMKNRLRISMLIRR